MNSPVENIAVAAIVAAMTVSVLSGGRAIMRRLHISPVPPSVACESFSYIYNDFIGGFSYEGSGN